jgi:alkaline phosphatase
VIALNSNCEVVACGPQSEQMRWLRADLAAYRGRCTLAYWHHPRYSSGFHGSDARTAPFWRALHQAGAELVLAGHDHDYERFAPQDARGGRDVTGIRSFVVGTGGKDFTELRSPRAPHSEFARDDMHGVLILRLYLDAYSWRYVGLDGRTVDYGRDSCH